jgi:hypothetical protein
MRGPTDVKVLGFNPQQMDTKTARRVPEERVSAIFGIPAVVVGLGAGLDRSTFANFAEAREAAYESNVIPSQRLLAAELRTQLLPDFGDVTKLHIGFDLRKVRVLQADENELHQRAREDLKAGGVTVNEFRKMIGLPPIESTTGDALDIPISVSPTHVDEVLEPAAQPALPAGQPAKVLPLAARKGRKSATSMGPALQRLRARLLPAAERDMRKFLDAQQKRIATRLEGKGKAAGGGPDPKDLLTPDEERQAEGESLSQLAARIRDLPAFNQARAMLVARTELGHATNLAAVHSYRASGVVVGVQVLDGDYDEACAAMNGRTFTLDEAPDPLQHPNCTRALVPITDPSELEAAA